MLIDSFDLSKEDVQFSNPRPRCHNYQFFGKNRKKFMLLFIYLFIWENLKYLLVLE